MKIEFFPSKIVSISSQGKLKTYIKTEGWKLTVRALLKLLNKINLSGRYHFLLISGNKLAIGLIASKFQTYNNACVHAKAL